MDDAPDGPELPKPIAPEQPQQLPRITGAFILSELAGVLNLERGVFFTIKAVLLRPGASVRRFLYEDRGRMTKPASLLVVCSLVYILAQRLLGFDDGYLNYAALDWGSSATAAIMDWISDNYGLVNILLANAIALCTKGLFRQSRYNLFEVCVLLYYAMGIQMLMLTLLGIVERITGVGVFDVGINFAILYVCWAIGQFFDERKKRNYLKALLGYVLGLVLILLVAVVLGVAADVVVE
ncbi:MAG: DUF3667 domain-containing protein [Bacteroidota bacterium]